MIISHGTLCECVQCPPYAFIRHHSAGGNELHEGHHRHLTAELVANTMSSRSGKRLTTAQKKANAKRTSMFRPRKRKLYRYIDYEYKSISEAMHTFIKMYLYSTLNPASITSRYMFAHQQYYDYFGIKSPDRTKRAIQITVASFHEDYVTLSTNVWATGLWGGVNHTYNWTYSFGHPQFFDHLLIYLDSLNAFYWGVDERLVQKGITSINVIGNIIKHSIIDEERAQLITPDRIRITIKNGSILTNGIVFATIKHAYDPSFAKVLLEHYSRIMF